LDIYQHLLRINAGYDQVIRSLASLRKARCIPARRTGSFFRLIEADPSGHQLLPGRRAMEIAETNEAGRRFCKRLAKERSDEQEN
jgi:hypothetical protein